MPLETDNDAYTPEYMTESRRISSRLAKREQKKLARQTLLFAGVAIVLFVVFLFVIVPGAVRFAGNIVGTNLGAAPDDTIPPVAPTVAAPVPATFSATLAVTGFAEAQSEAVLVLNNQEYAREAVNDEGAFEFGLDLEEGENTFSVYAVDAAGNESNTTRQYSVVLDTQAPEIVLEQPTDGAEIELKKNQLTQIKGTTEEKSKVYLNDRLLFTRADGSFSGTYQLQEGDNNLKFKVVDQAGNTTEQEITVKFRL